MKTGRFHWSRITLCLSFLTLMVMGAYVHPGYGQELDYDLIKERMERRRRINVEELIKREEEERRQLESLHMEREDIAGHYREERDGLITECQGQMNVLKAPLEEMLREINWQELRKARTHQLYQEKIQKEEREVADRLGFLDVHFSGIFESINEKLVAASDELKQSLKLYNEKKTEQRELIKTKFDQEVAARIGDMKTALLRQLLEDISNPALKDRVPLLDPSLLYEEQVLRILREMGVKGQVLAALERRLRELLSQAEQDLRPLKDQVIRFINDHEDLRALSNVNGAIYEREKKEIQGKVEDLREEERQEMAAIMKRQEILLQQFREREKEVERGIAEIRERESKFMGEIKFPEDRMEELAKAEQEIGRRHDEDRDNFEKAEEHIFHLYNDLLKQALIEGTDFLCHLKDQRQEQRQEGPLSQFVSHLGDYEGDIGRFSFLIDLDSQEPGLYLDLHLQSGPRVPDTETEGMKFKIPFHLFRQAVSSQEKTSGHEKDSRTEITVSGEMVGMFKKSRRVVLTFSDLKGGPVATTHITLSLVANQLHSLKMERDGQSTQKIRKVKNLGERLPVIYKDKVYLLKKDRTLKLVLSLLPNLKKYRRHLDYDKFARKFLDLIRNPVLGERSYGSLDCGKIEDEGLRRYYGVTSTLLHRPLNHYPEKWHRDKPNQK